MTREEKIDWLNKIKSEITYMPYDWLDPMDEALTDAIKALDQEPILDKIRAELAQASCEVENDYDRGRNYGLHIAIQIIDKYRQEG